MTRSTPPGLRMRYDSRRKAAPSIGSMCSNMCSEYTASNDASSNGQPWPASWRMMYRPVRQSSHTKRSGSRVNTASALSQPSPHLFHQSPPTCRYVIPSSASSARVTTVPFLRACSELPSGSGFLSAPSRCDGRTKHVLHAPCWQ